ncbi:MAG: 2Fe-2S iron-sulfur cluster-binding protein [Burkholderiaceae bacterium]
MKQTKQLIAQVTIMRGDTDKKSYEQRFDVPFESGASVLDGLIWIRVNADDSLAFRYSCISANVCKECVISIDGRKQYACTAKLVDGPMRLEPLPNKRRLRDLACDTVPPKEQI